MLSLVSLIALAASLTPAVLAQSPIWGQCGGQGWSGATTCATGSVCTFSNPYYSQCLPGTAAPTTVAPTSTSTVASSTAPASSTTVSGAQPTSGATCPNRSKFKFFGVNESGAEFGNTAWPGQLGKDYTWPEPSSIDYFVANGFNTFRVTFLMERMSPPATGLAGPFNQTYLSGLTTIVDYITSKGAFALIDPHNFMRYDNNVISNTTQFANWWASLATVFKSNNNVMFDIQNEPYGIDAGTVFNLNQAAVNAIRAAGATTQMIMAEGTSYTGAWTWTTSSGNSAAFGALKDPNNNIAIEMHQYLDSDGSGTNATCVSSTIGAERLAAATTWLQQNNLKGFLGEIGAGNDQTCIDAVAGAFCAMQQSGVWLGALWWAAGPWWGTYYQSIEPPTGQAITGILPLMQSFQ